MTKFYRFLFKGRGNELDRSMTHRTIYGKTGLGFDQSSSVFSSYLNYIANDYDNLADRNSFLPMEFPSLTVDELNRGVRSLTLTIGFGNQLSGGCSGLTELMGAWNLLFSAPIPETLTYPYYPAYEVNREVLQKRTKNFWKFALNLAESGEIRDETFQKFWNCLIDDSIKDNRKKWF